MSLDRVRTAYTARVDAYADLLGSVDASPRPHRDLIAGWAATVEGLILDVGCGPGHWTQFLHDAGHAAVGIDPVQAFLDAAARRSPHVAFRLGQAERLDVDDGSVGGILAWYSLVHTHPDDLDDALQEFARALPAGGRLLVGFCVGRRLEPFDHAVTTAWFWPVRALVARLEDAGFAVTGAQTRTIPSVRPHGAVTATRSQTCPVQVGSQAKEATGWERPRPGRA